MGESASTFPSCGCRVAAGAILAVAALTLSAPSGLAGGGLAALPGAASDSMPSDGSALASLTLASELDALQPGAETWIGLHFKMTDGWHLYWRNPGDSGAPMHITISAPPGVEVGEVVYPAPTRHDEPGGFVDFVYEGEVTLLVPITVSQSMPVGSSVKIEAGVNWLICSDMCLAGRGESSIALPIAGSAKATASAPLFASARARVPAPMGEASAAGIRASWSGQRTLDIAAPGAASLVFFPYESAANAYPQDMAEAGAVNGSSIRLEYNDPIREAERVGGVLEVRTPDKTSWYEIVVASPVGSSH